MAYIKPDSVDSPKSHWRLLKVLHDAGESGRGKGTGWSVAEGQWEDGGQWGNVLALRWNGNSKSQLGNPQSRGLPTWFILPAELEEAVREAVKKMSKRKGNQ